MTSTMTATISLDNINKEWVFETFSALKNPAWVIELRMQAFEKYQALPWPSKNDERWKRTDLQNLNWKNLTFSFTHGSALKEKVSAPANIQTLSLEEAVNHFPEQIKTAWSDAIIRAEMNKFLLLTLALGNGGTCIVIPDNVTASQNIHRYIDGGESGKAYFPLNFVFAKSHSSAQLWEHLGQQMESSVDFFVSTYNVLSLEADANLHLFSLQQWDGHVQHFQFQHIRQQKHSRYNSVAVALGARTFRNETIIDLSGQAAENKVLGVLFGEKNQNFENWITQNHWAPRTMSDIQVRGALKGSSKSFFSGLVSIVKEAQQSDAYQAAKSLLLSADARADAIPNLEILADDVKCSHGAAVGPVDEDQKFYLRSRGLTPKDAEQTIVQGFFEPVIEAIPSDEAREQLRAFIEKKLAS